MQKILLFGSQGMLGMELFETLQDEFEVIPFSRFNLDLTNIRKIIPVIEKIAPDIVINAAAYTDTEKAENPKLQNFIAQINTTAPGEMAKACEKIGAKFIHFSTDFVFNGKKKEKYEEDAKKNPLNFYGSTKAKGEDLIQKNCSNYYIVRLAWLFGKYGPNFVNNMLHIGKGRSNIEVAEDISVSMSYAKDVAESVKSLIQSDLKPGIYHFVNEGKFSLLKVTKMIFEIKGCATEIIPVSYKKFPTLVQRPEHAALINTKFKKLRPLKEALEDFIN